MLYHLSGINTFLYSSQLLTFPEYYRRYFTLIFLHKFFIRSHRFPSAWQLSTRLRRVHQRQRLCTSVLSLQWGARMQGQIRRRKLLYVINSKFNMYYLIYFMMIIFYLLPLDGESRHLNLKTYPSEQLIKESKFSGSKRIIIVLHSILCITRRNVRIIN